MLSLFTTRQLLVDNGLFSFSFGRRSYRLIKLQRRNIIIIGMFWGGGMVQLEKRRSRTRDPKPDPARFESRHREEHKNKL